jgi:hypothetical protein
MENVEQNGHGNPRMDRLEKLMDLLITDHLSFSDEHKKLLTAQVVLTDTVQKLGEAQRQAEERLNLLKQDLLEAQKHTDKRLNALIAVVDGLVRNRPSA